MNYKTEHDYEMSLRNLNEKSMSLMSQDEKVANFQYIENYNAELQGRVPGIVCVEKLEEGDLAQQRGIEIVIDENYIETADYKDLVNAVYHEGSKSHMGAFQAEYLESVKENLEFSQEEMKEFNDYKENMSFDEYYNHPAEIEARFEAEIRTNDFLDDQQIVESFDQTYNDSTNQILETYDYNVFELEDDNSQSYQEEISEDIEESYDLDEDNSF